MRALWALVRTDLGLYLADRRTLLMHVAAPIVIAAFFGYLFSDRRDEATAKIPVAVADLDRSPLSKDVVAALAQESMLAVTAMDETVALAEVKRGRQQVLVVIPAGFGAAAGPAPALAACARAKEAPGPLVPRRQGLRRARRRRPPPPRAAPGRGPL